MKGLGSADILSGPSAPISRHKKGLHWSERLTVPTVDSTYLGWGEQLWCYDERCGQWKIVFENFEDFSESGLTN